MNTLKIYDNLYYIKKRMINLEKKSDFQIISSNGIINLSYNFFLIDNLNRDINLILPKPINNTNIISIQLMYQFGGVVIITTNPLAGIIKLDAYNNYINLIYINNRWVKISNNKKSYYTIAVGNGDVLNKNTIAYSNDGIKWNPIIGSENIFTDYGNSVAWNGKLWVAVGSNIGTVPPDNPPIGIIAYSTDGINWTTITNIISRAGYSVAWNGTLWIAVGDGDTVIVYSSDGINWNGVPNSKTTIFNGGYANYIAWDGKQWVAVGSGTNSIAYSINGINWYGLGKADFVNRCNGIASNGTLWVAVGSGVNGTGVISYSTNLVDWVKVTDSENILSEGFSIAWNGYIWVAVGIGSNTIAYSRNGMIWYPVIGSGTILSTYGIGVGWNGKLWIAVGNGSNTIAYSNDGMNWNPVIGSKNIFSHTGGGVAGNSNINSVNS